MLGSSTFSSVICPLCPPTGNLCQVNINECASSPCLNKGTCVDGVASFTCLCELPYSGPTCAEVLTPCSPNPCANHAMCTHTPDYLGYQCNCQSGWQGKLNLYLLSHCLTIRKSVWILEEIKPYFTLLLHSSGQLCNIDVNECISNPCKNRGTCTNTLGGFVCSCRAGFTGLTCETDINDCSPSEWQRKHSMLNNCNCLLLSNTVPGPCILYLTKVILSFSDPCLSGGSCTDGVNSFHCSCLAGFTGPRCALEINECQSNPCKNGGTCTDYVNSYTCTCRPGFTGIHCETNIPDCTER